MNPHELAIARWRRLEGALRDDLDVATRRAQETIAAIVASMEAQDVEDPGNSVPPAELVDELVALHVRKRVLADRVLPAVEQARQYVFAQRVPLPQPVRRG